MATRLIELQDSILVEIEIQGKEVEQVSANLAKKVNTTIDNIRPILTNVCRPIIATWKELNKEMNIEQAEVELGLSFEGEGNLYVTKSKAGANLTIKLVLKPER